jgi:hypothetical protein
MIAGQRDEGIIDHPTILSDHRLPGPCNARTQRQHCQDDERDSSHG